MRTSKGPRTIKAEQILIGDTIRVSWKDRDVTYTVVGTVARREHDNSGTEWFTSEMFVLVYRDNAMRVFNGGRGSLATITLLHRQADTTTRLDGIEL